MHVCCYHSRTGTAGLSPTDTPPRSSEDDQCGTADAHEVEFEPYYRFDLLQVVEASVIEAVILPYRTMVMANGDEVRRAVQMSRVVPNATLRNWNVVRYHCFRRRCGRAT